MTQPVARGVVQAFYKAYAERDAQKIASFLDENVEWMIAGPTGLLPYCGMHRGKAAVMELFGKTIPSVFEFKGFDPEELLIDGDRAAMYGKMFGLQRSTGRMMRYRHAQFLRFRGDKLVYVHAILDGFDLAEQWLGRPIHFESAPGLVPEDGNLVAV